MAHNYNIKLELTPPEHGLRADVVLSYVVAKPVDTLEFILHRNLTPTITSQGLIHVERVDSTSYPFTPEAVTWRLKYAVSLAPGAQVDIAFAYQGEFPEVICHPWGVNRVTKEWVELGMYGPWFPWDPTGGAFSYNLDLKIPGYSTVTTGTAVEVSEGQWEVKSNFPVEDMVIAAAPELKMVSQVVGSVTLQVYHTGVESASAVESVVQDGLWLLEFFGQWLGGAVDARSLSIVGAPRELGGGYARPGLVIISNLSQVYSAPDQVLFKWLAHEVGHLWWAGAAVDTWEDWLNESFAEFSKLMAVKAKLGEDAYGSLLATLKEKAQSLPAIKGIERTSEQAYNVLYRKGAVVLHRLQQLIGEAKMTELLRRRLTERVMTTEALLALLKEIADENAAEELIKWLSE